ncbi:hypothetical protein XENTR_v10008997 [Xenopus tropicalis]|uniref:Lactamase beta n=1 Tax=Xenopus tropicalis TaxID=8364 RepID=A0A803KER9_XENTR|nr:serine beta-lactamase-like protein LACTB, mitochondrial [Xenopus tropicalis]KAE8617159.1 hypothetical protein XENTR_v10008997 [Xenopus tropicalis]|eukprot:XP_002934597.1 PREDICTED: serine beta-lactamase-like protein LACTB, mitochondrial [Xenopus tropicalis]
MLSRLLRPGRALPAMVMGLGLAMAAARIAEDEAERKRKGPGAYSRAIERSQEFLRRIKDEVGSPGMVVGVSVDGEAVWTEGLGFADIENSMPCAAESVMRVASISKSFTMAALAKLWEEGKLDLDAPVQQYVPEFPVKEFEGEKVTISPRLLISHLSGIRHYEKDIQKVRKKIAKKSSQPESTATEGTKEKSGGAFKAEFSKPEAKCGTKEQDISGTQKDQKDDVEEFYIKEKFETVIDALELFKNDPLVFKPGTQFLYSTHAWTLLSAVVERASGQKFLEYMKQMFKDMGMKDTVAEEHEPIIYNRARFYTFNDKKRLINAPYVDNSCKWAGGGFLSTVNDLLTFGNVLLYSYQASTTSPLPGFLKKDTMSMVWKQVHNTEMSWDKDGKYAMGWGTVEENQECGYCKHQKHYVSHTGGAVGASSVILILPEEENTFHLTKKRTSPPKGIVVAIICNMQGVGLNSTALKIALEFEKDKSICS